MAGAQSQAAAAARKAEGVDSRLTRLWSNRFNQKTADSLEVYFSPDSIDLSDAAQTALAAVVKEMAANPTLTVELGGYTDPRGALDGGPDGLRVIRRIVAEAPQRLLPGGALVLETSGDQQARAVVALMEKAGFGVVETRRDLAGVERFVAGKIR